MGDKFTYSMLEIVVGQLCLHMGFKKCEKAALEVMTDVLHNYLKDLLTRIGSYTENCGRTQPTLKDVFLAFKDFHIDIDELQEYIKSFGEVPPAVQVPKYPIPREHNYSILQPDGSCELVARSDVREVNSYEEVPPAAQVLRRSLPQEHDYSVLQPDDSCELVTSSEVHDVTLFGEVSSNHQINQSSEIQVPNHPREHNYSIQPDDSCELRTRSDVHEHFQQLVCPNSVTNLQIQSNSNTLNHSSNNMNVETGNNETCTKENLCKQSNRRSANDCTATKDGSKDSTSDRCLRELTRIVIKKVGNLSSSYVVVNPELAPERTDATDASPLTVSESFVSGEKAKKHKKRKRRKDVARFEEEVNKHKHKKSKKKRRKVGKSSFKT